MVFILLYFSNAAEYISIYDVGFPLSLESHKVFFTSRNRKSLRP